MPTLGQELSRLRRLKAWTLRDAEEKSGKKVSNSYLYQLENDNVKEPSPHILYELSVVYGAAYSELMRLAGFVVPNSSPQASQTSASVSFSALNLSDEEREEVMDFIEVRRRKKKRTDENPT
jgi:HTH-type transcriptional regulator, competence development regulator